MAEMRKRLIFIDSFHKFIKQIVTDDLDFTFRASLKSAQSEDV
jgi:hypothetical protein